jgi:hypothetical protein
MGILDEFIRQSRHMDKTILMHPDIDEGAEGSDVRHDTFENHACVQVS